MPEHGLQPDGGTFHPVADQLVTPQAELAPLVGHQLVGDQAQHGDAARALIRRALIRRAAVLPGPARMPAVQLPAHPLRDRQRGQQPVMTP